LGLPIQLLEIPGKSPLTECDSLVWGEIGGDARALGDTVGGPAERFDVGGMDFGREGEPESQDRRVGVSGRQRDTASAAPK
jgi:hypothetical protein